MAGRPSGSDLDIAIENSQEAQVRTQEVTHAIAEAAA
jgi:hypothetical protein